MFWLGSRGQSNRLCIGRKAECYGLTLFNQLDVLAEAAAVGCGGSSGSGSGSTTTAATTTAANERLSAAQWQSYESAAKSFKAANTEANARLKKCPVPANGQ